jgi:hypothetical protein
VGTFYVNTVDSASAAAWGKLWVEYDIDFYTPQAQSGMPVGVPGGKLTGITSLTPALPFGTAGAFDAQSSGVSYSGSTGMITFQRTGVYVIAISIGGTTLSAVAYTLSGVTNTASASTFNTAATAGTMFAAFTVTSNNGTAIVSLTGATVTSAFAYVASAPDGSIS